MPYASPVNLGHIVADQQNLSTSQRIRPIDGLRGVAALMVVGFHYFGEYPRLYGGTHLPGASLGVRGVDLLFVISGFVILMSLRTGSVQKFVKARALRLFPAYWASMALTLLVVATLGLPGGMPSLDRVLLNVTMLNKFFGVNGVDGVYWTLAAELAFYVQAAVLHACGLLTERRIAWTVTAWVAITAAVAAVLPGRYQAIGFHVGSDSQWVTSAHIVVDFVPFFALGVVALLIVRGRRDLGVLSATALSLGVIAALGTLNSAAVGAVALGVVLTVVLVNSLGMDSAPLRFLGRISYELYLLHQFIGFAIMLRLTSLGLPHPAAAILAFLVVFFLAYAVTAWVDEPVRRRFSRSRLVVCL